MAAYISVPRDLTKVKSKVDEKKAAYPDYRKAKEEMQEWAKAKKNMELFFAEETKPKEQIEVR